MKYETIFKRIPIGDQITLSQYPCFEKLYDCEGYRFFVEDKLRVRKEIEKQYKNASFKRGSFRMFLEYCVKSHLESKPISHVLAHIDDDKTKPVSSLPWYDQGEDEIVSDIQKKLKELYDRQSDIQNIMTETFWNNDKAFQKIGLRPYFQKLDFVGLYELKNALYRIDITFELNDDVRKIFIEKVKDDWGNEIDQFQDVIISYQGEELFGSTTHEDCYYYNKKRLDEIKRGLKLE